MIINFRCNTEHYGLQRQQQTASPRNETGGPQKQTFRPQHRFRESRVTPDPRRFDGETTDDELNGRYPTKYYRILEHKTRPARPTCTVM